MTFFMHISAQNVQSEHFYCAKELDIRKSAQNMLSLEVWLIASIILPRVRETTPVQFDTQHMVGGVTLKVSRRDMGL